MSKAVSFIEKSEEGKPCSVRYCMTFVLQDLTSSVKGTKVPSRSNITALITFNQPFVFAQNVLFGDVKLFLVSDACFLF